MMTMESLEYVLGAVAALLAAWFAVTRLVRFLGWVERSEIARQQAEAKAATESKTAQPAAPVAVAPQQPALPPHHVAAIAAAVAAYGYRVVHIADATTGSAWAAEGRWRHQTSHHPH
jgi:hypothetical protein